MTSQQHPQPFKSGFQAFGSAVSRLIRDCFFLAPSTDSSEDRDAFFADSDDVGQKVITVQIQSSNVSKSCFPQKMMSAAGDGVKILHTKAAGSSRSEDKEDLLEADAEADKWLDSLSALTKRDQKYSYQLCFLDDL